MWKISLMGMKKQQTGISGHSEKLCIHGRIILKWILRDIGVNMWRLNWLKGRVKWRSFMTMMITGNLLTNW
jgi:hypothetical protein